MNSIFKWIWSAIKWTGKKVVSVFEAVWNVLASALTWVCGSVTYLCSQFWQWVTSCVQSFVGTVSNLFPSIDDTGFMDGSLFGHLCQLLAVDELLTAIGIVITAFVLARLARLAMMPVRALLEIL